MLHITTMSLEIPLSARRSYIHYLTLSGLNCIHRSEAIPNSNPISTHALSRLSESIVGCSRCPLHKQRTHIVFGEGNPHSKLMFIGEGPGHDEDLQGRPFVGRAGQLLTKIIQAMKIKREDVYITNIIKCRPPNNREPEEIEIETCSSYLTEQIRLIQPEVTFYKKMEISIPRQCFFCRHRNRLARRGPMKLFDRGCAKCKKPIKTNFAPDRPEIVYCENCYQNEVI